MDEYLRKLAQATPLDEPDRSSVHWRKRRWVLAKGKTTTQLKTHRPPVEAYYAVLRKARVNLCVCVLCGSDDRITVHHKDGNPYNNCLENLQVLCWHCHLTQHDPNEEDVHSELEGTKADLDTLDDKNVREFYGIQQEE